MKQEPAVLQELNPLGKGEGVTYTNPMTADLCPVTNGKTPSLAVPAWKPLVPGWVPGALVSFNTRGRAGCSE